MLAAVTVARGEVQWQARKAHAAQKRQGIGRETVCLNGSKFFVLQATVEKAK